MLELYSGLMKAASNKMHTSALLKPRFPVKSRLLHFFYCLKVRKKRLMALNTEEALFQMLEKTMFSFRFVGVTFLHPTDTTTKPCSSYIDYW